MRTNVCPADLAIAETRLVFPTPGEPSSSNARGSCSPLSNLWAFTHVVGAVRAYLSGETPMLGPVKKRNRFTREILCTGTVYWLTFIQLLLETNWLPYIELDKTCYCMIIVDIDKIRMTISAILSRNGYSNYLLKYRMDQFRIDEMSWQPGWQVIAHLAVLQGWHHWASILSQSIV